jgi:membrane protein required for colicin V production
MTAFDFAVIGVIVLSAVLAARRGTANTLIELGIWIGGFALAPAVVPFVRPYMIEWLDSRRAAEVDIFLATMLLCALVLKGIARMTVPMPADASSVAMDRTIGSIFGLIRGFVLVSAGVMVMAIAGPVDNWPLNARDARFLPALYESAKGFRDLAMPADLRLAMYDPPHVNGRMAQSRGPSAHVKTIGTK